MSIYTTIGEDPYNVLWSERAYELLAGDGYSRVHTVLRYCYPGDRSIGTLPAGPCPYAGYIPTDPEDHDKDPITWTPSHRY